MGTGLLVFSSLACHFLPSHLSGLTFGVRGQQLALFTGANHCHGFAFGLALVLHPAGGLADDASGKFLR
jgi:hypothetical protein